MNGRGLEMISGDTSGLRGGGHPQRGGQGVAPV